MAGLELQQQLRLSQQLVMTPQLQMAIKLLQLSRIELLETIQQEIEENPALEEVQETVVEETAEKSLESEPPDQSETKEVTIEEKIRDDIDWSNYFDEYSSRGRVNFESESKESPRFESFVAKKESLQDHLLWQLLMLSPTEVEQKIGSLIIGNLNRDGYLDISVEEISRLSHMPLEAVTELLSVMQTFDPIGVCARDLEECLLIQTKHYNIDNTIVTRIIQHHLKELENNNYKAISKALKIRIEDVAVAVSIITGFEPRPGRQFSDDTPQYINPDIYVHKYDNDFVIMLNEDGMPKLRLNAFYQNSKNNSKKTPGPTRDYIQEKIRSASWLIKSIQQRQKTIYRVMESILGFQKEFFEKGIAHLRPMVLKDVALDIDMHESTISRVTTNKYAYTPQGIYELKFFFNSSIKRSHGGAVASASVMDKIRQIILNENSKKPYSDDKISKLLKEEGISIARRTVAKYRELLKVLPSNKRKQI